MMFKTNLVGEIPGGVLHVQLAEPHHLYPFRTFLHRFRKCLKEINLTGTVRDII